MSELISINLKTKGRNTIPTIKSDNIITLHGKNGVGKSMASTLMEIASGNYVFENQDRFEKLKKIFDECNITFVISDSIYYEAQLKPYLWKFENSLNRVNPLTLGEFYANDKEISFEDFKKLIFIRTIRGNESLHQQILFFKDVFIGKIEDQIQKIEKKEVFLEKYKVWLENIATEEKIKDYKQLQGLYNDKLNENQNLTNTIINRNSKINNQAHQIKILNNLKFIITNDKGNIESDFKVNEEKDKKIQEQINIKYAKLKDIKLKINDLNQNFDRKAKKIVSILHNHYKKQNKLKKQIEEDHTVNLDEIEEKKESIQTQIDRYDKNIIVLKKNIESLNKEHEKVIQINKYIISMRDILGKASSNSFAENNIIKGKDFEGQEFSISFKQLYHIFTELNLDFNQNEELNQYKEEVIKINHEITTNKSLLGILNEYNSVSQEIVKIEKKISGSHKNLDEYIDIEKKIAHLEENHESTEQDLKNLEKEKEKILLNKKKSEEILLNLAKIPSKSVLLSQLREINLNIPEPTLDLVINKLSSIEKEQKENSKKILLNEEQKKEIEIEIQKIKKDLSEFTKILKKNMKDLGKSNLGEFVEEIIQQHNKLNSYIQNTNKIRNYLIKLRSNIEKIVSGKNIRNTNIVQIINSYFNKIFKDIYGRKEFFEFVFKDYTKIKNFDLSQKTIVFETHGGLEEKRDLEEFSSGEKTYAYCRAIISMAANVAKHNIIILDESYALLDHEHSQNLYQFQFEMIKNKGIAKFINILPIKDNLDNIVKNIEKNLSYEKGKGDSKQIEQMQKSLNIAKGFHEEVSKYGYYQELLFPNNKSLENLNKYISFNGLEEKNQGNDVSEEKLAYSFILDGSNISRNNQNSKFAKISDVIKCRKKLMEYGIPKENIIILFGAGIRHHIAEIERGQFNNLLKEHNNNQAPKGIDDDYFIIKYALNNDSYIITNDYFKEYQINYPNYKNFLHEHSIRYNVIRNDIIFEPDFEEKLKNIIK